MNQKPNTSLKYEDVLVDLVSSGLGKDMSKFELAAITLSRVIKEAHPQVAQKINSIVGQYSLHGNQFRGVGMPPSPYDTDTQLDMSKTVMPNKELYKAPILSAIFKEKIDNFLEERRNIELLLSEGVRPTNSLLLIGKPGTGKTMLAHYLATEINKPLVVLDLSISISSLLGKTGHNLKKVFEYARQNSAVLLLDEFDAIAKRRDDFTDLGEIKRIVNVLLMELESWPVSSVLIGTSNHPELLDRAIWRRFDHVMELDLPGQDERVELLNRQLGSLFGNSEIPPDSVIRPISEILSNYSPADICRYSENVKRRVVLKKEEPTSASLHELELYVNDKKVRGKFCYIAKKIMGDAITVRELSNITGLSIAGVHHHISKS